MLSIEHRYFEWLCNLAAGELQFRALRYKQLLSQLHDTSFEYSVDLDGNRAEDGYALRYRFGQENNISDARIANTIDSRKKSSVLEVMVALAVRCEEQIMDDPDVGNRIGQWFWDMVRSLGLLSMDDANYDEVRVYNILQRFLNREYARNGRGGLFTVNTDRYDLRSAEIWYQMSWYLHELT